jgi:TolB-like protein/DNA-binding winged helix-turn-helix (wHTH) protein
MYEFEGLQLDPIQYLLRQVADGQAVHLTGRAFEALSLLVQHHGELVDKATLIKALWPKVIVEESNLTQTIYALRQALGERPGENRFIATVPGRGYRFVAEVREVASAGVSGTPTPSVHSAAAVPAAVPSAASESAPVAVPAMSGATPSAAPSHVAAPKARRPLVIRLAAVGLALAVIGAVGWVLQHRTGVSVSPTAGTVAASNIASRRSVAVLPFANLTGDAGKDYWGDGVAEELINTLSKIPGLKVPARSSSFAYKGRNVDVRQIARDLGVDAVLEGSVRSAGDRIRITAELSDASNGFRLWSESYDRRMVDLFKLQDELATTIEQALQLTLEGGAQIIMTQAAPTKDVEAYQLTLQGFGLLERGGRQGAFSALDFFQRAIARDPGYARAYAGAATAHLRASRFIQPPQPHLVAAEQAARHALQLDPNSAKAESVLGELALKRRDMVAAEEHHRRAALLDPNDALIRFDHALVQGYVGHMREAVQQMREAYALAPAIPQVVIFAGIVHSWAGLDAEALKYAELAAALGVPASNDDLGEIHGAAALRTRRYADYLHDSFLPSPSETSADITPAQELSRVVLGAVADAGKRAAARAARTQFYPPGGTLTSAGANRCGYNGTRAYVVLGDLDAAYALANQCLDEAPVGVLGGEACPWQPEWRDFRKDPRFQAYIARRGAIPYYEKYGPPDDCDFRDGKLTCH